MSFLNIPHLQMFLKFLNWKSNQNLQRKVWEFVLAYVISLINSFVKENSVWCYLVVWMLHNLIAHQSLMVSVSWNWIYKSVCVAHIKKVMYSLSFILIHTYLCLNFPPAPKEPKKESKQKITPKPVRSGKAKTHSCHSQSQFGIVSLREG